MWVEKEALAGVIYPITARYDVPLMVGKGYASKTYLYEAAAHVARQLDAGKLVMLYQLGDWDPSGVDIRRVARTTITRYTIRALVDELGYDAATAAKTATEETLSFATLALNEADIARFQLPTRPTKLSDSRSAGFRGESVELDALPPDELRRIVEVAIARFLPEGALDAVRLAEASEREVLARIVETLRRTAA